MNVLKFTFQVKGLSVLFAKVIQVDSCAQSQPPGLSNGGIWGAENTQTAASTETNPWHITELLWRKVSYFTAVWKLLMVFKYSSKTQQSYFHTCYMSAHVELVSISSSHWGGRRGPPGPSCQSIMGPQRVEWDKNPLTSREDLEQLINLMHVFERWTETHTWTGRTYKVHTEQLQYVVKPVTFYQSFYLSCFRTATPFLHPLKETFVM